MLFYHFFSSSVFSCLQLQQEVWCCSSIELHLLPLWNYRTPHQELPRYRSKTRTCRQFRLQENNLCVTVLFACVYCYPSITCVCVLPQDKNFEALPRLKKSTGIPRSFMVEVDDPSIKGAMLTNSGHYAIPAIHA